MLPEFGGPDKPLELLLSWDSLELSWSDEKPVFCQSLRFSILEQEPELIRLPASRSLHTSFSHRIDAFYRS
jgi:hypothetical protein